MEGCRFCVAVVLAVGGCYTGLTGAAVAGDEAEVGSTSRGGEPGEGDGSDGGGGPPQAGADPLRRLTADQYRRTVRDLAGVRVEVEGIPPDEKAGPFDSNHLSPVDELVVRRYQELAEAVAAEVVARPLPCEGAVDCPGTFVRDFARRAFRRPLTAEDEEPYLGLLAGAETLDEGLRLALSAVLQSPHFLYHVERGHGDPTEAVELTDHELASRLSYFLWGTMPDEELREAAEAGLDAAGVQAQVDRMLIDPRARESVAAFHRQWLELDEHAAITKDPDLFPAFDAALRDAMFREVEDFAVDVLLVGDGSLSTLLTADFTVADSALHELYGVQTPAGYRSGDHLPLPEGERAGLLTSAAFLATHAHADQPSPVPRGVFVRRSVLCGELLPPPPTADNTPPPPNPDATTRERFEEHSRKPDCIMCHLQIDGLGFGFEHYDAIGAYRELENGQPVDASGWINLTDDIDGDFVGAVELAELLAGSKDVAECVTRQWFRYSRGRLDTAEDEETIAALLEAFDDSGRDVRDLIVEIATSEAYRRRGRVRGGKS